MADEEKKQDVNSLISTNDVVTIISNDKKVFYVNKDVVCVSKHLGNQLRSSFREGGDKRISLDLPSTILEVCIKYMHYKLIYAPLAPEQRPEFAIEPVMALDVLNAAIYLQCWNYFSWSIYL